MPFNLGGGELVFVLVIVLIVFGAGKLPDVLGQLGRGVKTFREEATGENKPAATTTTDTTKPS
ncbi:MAG: twin-arginine translocase TatA/TatE family subunit [Chloroflexi bacterium]|nr:twin-arginine translocase TatA/TatE family subunit [Chloroflexota bacterium]